MSSASDYLENHIINHLLRNQAFTPPSTLYLALYTTATTDAGGGTEVTGGSYARQTFTLTAATTGATENVADINFTNLPACTVTNWGIRDAVSSGNLLVHDTFSSPIVVTAGYNLRVIAGALDLAAF